MKNFIFCIVLSILLVAFIGCIKKECDCCENCLDKTETSTNERFDINQIENQYYNTIDKYFDFSIKCNINNLSELAPEEFWQSITNDYGVTVENIKNELKESYEKQLTALKNEFGESVKVVYTILDEKELDKYDLEDIKQNLSIGYGISMESVEKAVEIELKYTINGSYNEDTEKQNMVLVKIGNKWYIPTAFSTLKYYAY